ncbi:MAG: DUF2225 domain-containing protein, partial [Candidatus Anammoxibacter sp.]
NRETRLIVTTQTLSEYHQCSGFELYEIQPFKKEDVIAYLAQFRDKFESSLEAESFYENLPELIKEFISIPVFLYFMVSIYEKGKPFEINSPGNLICKYEEFLFGMRDGEFSRSDMEDVYRKELIPFIAFNMCQNSEIDITVNRFNHYVNLFKEKYNYTSSIDEIETMDIVTNRFMLMKSNEKGELRFILQTLRDYLAAVYMKNEIKNNELNPGKIFGLVYTDSIKNSDIANAVKLLAGIVRPEIVKEIIQPFIEKELYLACEIFAWSSIEKYEEVFIDLIKSKIDINSREYLLNLNEAVSFYIKVLDILQKCGKGGEPDYALCNMNLGVVYWSKLDNDDAIDSYKLAIEILKKNNMQAHPDYALCYMNLGITYRSKLDHDRAIDFYKDAIGIYKENNMQTHPDYARCHMNMGCGYGHKSNHDGAINAFKMAIGIYEKNNMHEHPDYAICNMNLGVAYNNKLNHDKAINAFKKAIVIYEKNLMNDHPDYALCHMNLGETYRDKGEKDEAIKSFELALSILKQSVGNGHPYYNESLRILKDVRSK